MVCAVMLLALGVFSVLAIAQESSTTATGPANGRGPLILASGIAVRALALDSRANMYLTTASAGNRVFTLTGLADLASNAKAAVPATPKLALIAGTGTSGSLGDGGDALGAQFDLSLNSFVLRSGIAVAPDGTLFVADTMNSTIRRVAGSDSSEPGIVRSLVGRWASRQAVTLSEPLGLALDRAGNLYIADHAAGAIDLLPAATDSAAAGNQLIVLAHVASPANLALTFDGSKLFVASPGNGAVFSIDTQTRTILPVAGFQTQANQAPNAPVCSLSTATSTATEPVCPAGVAVDGRGNLFVADANSGRILRVDATSSQVTAVASGLKFPGEMSFDTRGNLYVAEQGANQVLQFAGIGQDVSNLTITPPAPLPPPPAPRVCPSTAPFNFCDQPTGGATAPQAFTLTNNTGTAVSGLAFSFTGANPTDFQAPGNSCGTSLQSGSSCTINVDFAPTTTGTRSATLSVTDSAGDSATADVSGTGDDYQLTLNGSPQEQSVFQGGTVTFKFNVTPDANFGGDVTIVCPPNMPPLTTCTQNPTTVSVSPGTPTAFSVTFATTFDGILGGSMTSGSLPLSSPDKRGHHGSWPFLLFWVPVAVLILLSDDWLTRRLPANFSHARAPRLVWTSLLLAVGAAVLMAGCKKHSVPTNLNTPIGVTNLTIQGGAQNAGRGVTIILDVVAH